MRMLGIDPGSSSPSGAVYQAVPEGKGGIVHAFDVPMTGTKGEDWRVDVLAFARVIETWGCSHATIERVWAMPSSERESPTCDRCLTLATMRDGRWKCSCGNINRPAERGMGVAGAFNFGVAFGDLRTLVRCCGLEPLFVVPQTWKKHYGIRGSNKEDSRGLALELFPDMAHLLARKKDEGRAEAMLIARYGAMVATGRIESVGRVRGEAKAAKAAKQIDEIED